MKRLFKSDFLKISVSLGLFVLGFIFDALSIYIVPQVLFFSALAVSGIEVFSDAFKGLIRRDPLDEKFLMSVAAVGAMIVGEWSEGAAVMIFYLVGETFEHRAVRRSRASIKALMDICPDEATVIIDEREIRVDAEDVEIGSTVVIRPGERVAVDSVVISGNADVDTSSMTGEAMPIFAKEGTKLFSGYVVNDGVLYAKAEKAASESAAARVLELVEFASDNKSREENFITSFSRYYTPIIVIAALLVAIIPPILGIFTISEAVYTALTFLVISCPCALVISVPLAFFGGIGGAASRGILFKGGNVFSKIAKPETIAFDKTGTITSGRFDIVGILPCEISGDELLSVAASLEYTSNHPIAECIKNASNNILETKNAKELSGLGVIAEISGVRYAVGNPEIVKKMGTEVPPEYMRDSAVYVACDGKFLGTLAISDIIKSEAEAAIAELHKEGASRTAILSGDREENVIRVANSVGIKEAYFGLRPDEKYAKLEELIHASESTLYVGDGINDAPSLARADVGIAMGSMGQDSAIEVSDVVIMTDDLMKIPEAVKIARKTLRIARENIVFAIGVKALILLLGVFGLANMWLAVFADVGVAVLAVLNSMRALRYNK